MSIVLILLPAASAPAMVGDSRVTRVSGFDEYSPPMQCPVNAVTLVSYFANGNRVNGIDVYSVLTALGKGRLVFQHAILTQ